MALATASPSTQERAGAVTFKGSPLTAIGPAIRVGAKAPEFQILAQDLSPITLATFAGRPILIISVPSLDTPVCDAETRRFNEEAAQLPGVELLTVSMDLPFAQKRWCGAAGITRITVASDHHEASFGRAYGTLIKELRLLSRAIFIVDAGGVVRYVEYVPEIASHPNYDAALSVVRQLTPRTS